MKVTAALVGTLLLFALPGAAHAVNMFAGPLFPTGTDRCECEIVNVTTTAKNVRVVAVAGDGGVLADSGVFSLPAGTAVAFDGGHLLQYCKFVNASPYYFRASIACFGTPNTSDNVALPAR